MPGMKNLRITPLLLSGLLIGAAGAAQASSFASSASDSASSTTSSASDSLGDSSRSSSDGGQKVAAGEYRVLTVATGPRAGTVQARLRKADDESGDEFTLVLPQQAALKGGLATDARVAVSEQGYGWAFARADNREVFFLALNDKRELQSQAL